MKDERLRTVSDLRIQYMCEYRLHIKRSRGEQATEAGLRGSSLHYMASNKRPEEADNSWIAILILMVGILAALLWIVG